MKISRSKSGFALAITLVLMALAVIVIVAYLANTRTDRSTSSMYANQLKARMMAESGMAAATELLYSNTRYGNYITAMPAPSSPTKLYTEVYRPTDSTDTTVAKANDYLQLTNAAGEILVSRVTGAATGQVDPRPAPPMIPSAGPFTIADPGLTSSNSYDFNQIVRLGTNATGRLVQPSPTPAYGQWVRVRNGNNELIGRYAFFIEDESMKVNVNISGNNLASPSPTASPNLRVNDLATLPVSIPASQIQEVDPTSILLAASRQAATGALVGLGVSGQRLPSKLSTGLVTNWTSIENYAHLLTTVSKDDNTTAKGWLRMDINKVVADAEAIGTTAAKAAAATKIANWIRDAWTGPTALSGLQYSQIFNDSRLRLQIAANIVDYIDSDSIPTDVGDVVPAGYTEAIPILGIEKVPYLVALEIIYQASNSDGASSANLKLKIQFRFLNLYESDLDLANSVGRIEVKGVPILTRNGSTVLDVSTTNYVIPFANLTPVTPGTTVVPKGVDGTSTSGAKTFQTGWLEDRAVTFDGSGTSKPILVAGKTTVKVFGANGERLDDTAVVTNSISTGYQAPSSGNDSVGDFLKDATAATGPLQVASINLVDGFGTPPDTWFETGDPRYRGQLLNDRWRNLSRSDASLPATTNRIAQFIDKAELNARAFGLDWFDNIGDRPLAFIRNGPMRGIGELGNVPSAEYYWRTLYLQHPERPTNTSQIGPKDAVPLRRAQSQDYVLVDLFRAGGANSSTGDLNINTQQQFLQSGGTTPVLPLQSLFLGVPLSTSLPSPTPMSLTQAAPAAPAPSPADRLSTGVNLLVNSMTVAPAPGQFIGTVPLPYRIASISNKRSSLVGETATPDNNPARPYFEIGEVASTLSRLLSASESSDTGSSTSRSKVVYSALRSDPQSTTTVQFYRRDFQVEQVFREISNSITTRGNVFRVLYVGQSIRDVNKNGLIDDVNEVQSEYLGEAFVERNANYLPEGGNPDAMKTSDSSYKILASRVITQ